MNDDEYLQNPAELFDGYTGEEEIIDSGNLYFSTWKYPKFPTTTNPVEWAKDDRLWNTQKTVEFSLRMYAKVLLNHQRDH